MKKGLSFLIVLFLLVSCGFAENGEESSFLSDQKEIKFRDVPDSHWAAKAVYRLVKLGVTRGFPDGTFRGSKTMTRYETAAFLVKLADNFSSAGIEKLSAELKSEFQSLKQEIRESSRIKFAGQFELEYYLADAFTSATDISGNKVTRVPLVNYRLVSKMTSSFGNFDSFNVTLDTMDGGFYGGSQDLLTKMLDVESVISFDSKIPLKLTATAGPGPQRHLSGQREVPSEYGKAYIRPYSGVRIDTKLAKADIGLAYKARNIGTTTSTLPGQAVVNQVSAQIGWSYDKVFLLGKGNILFSGDYFSKNTLNSSIGLSNTKASVLIVSNPKNGVKLSGEIKAGRIKGLSTKNLVYAGRADFTDSFVKDSDFGFGATLAGSEYIVEPVELDEWPLIGFDPFSRARINGCRSIDAYLIKTIKDYLKLTAKANIDLSSDYKFGAGYAGSRSTVEGGLNIILGSQSEAKILYRVENNPNAIDTTTDLFTFAFLNRF